MARPRPPLQARRQGQALQGHRSLVPLPRQQPPVRNLESPHVESPVPPWGGLDIKARGESAAVRGELRESGLGECVIFAAGESDGSDCSRGSEIDLPEFQFCLRPSVSETKNECRTGPETPRRDQSFCRAKARSGLQGVL